MHPDHRVGIEQWLRRIDSQVAVGERFFKSETSGMFKAMPAVWKDMTIERRHELVNTMDAFQSKGGPRVWTKENVLALVKFAPLDSVSKLRTCYLAAKRDPSVFVEDDRAAHVNPPATILNQNAGMAWATWRPEALMASYKENRSDTNLQTSTLHHITNFVARNHWNWKGNNNDNVPSSYLNVEVSSIQAKLFNPTVEDLIMGAAVTETMGEGAKKKLAKRRLEAMGGNVASYACVLNSTERMVAIKEAKALHAVVAEVSAEIEMEKLMRAQKKEIKKADGELKKKKAMEALALKRKELMPQLLKHVAGGMEHVQTQKIAILKDILTVLAGVQGLSGLTKSELKSKIVENWSAITSAQSSPEEPTGGPPLQRETRELESK